MSVGLELRDGVEVRVEAGVGHIAKLDPPKGRNAHLEIAADGLRLPIQGWVDTTNFDLYDRCLDAFQNGRRVRYRVVIKRKADQDPSVPLEAIDRFNRVRDVEMIELLGGAATATPANGPAEAAQAAPPAPQAPPAPTDTPEAPPAPTAAPQAAPCGECHARGPEHAPGCGAAPAEEPSSGDAGTTDPSCPARATNVVDGKRGPRVAEGKPWEPFNSDGSRNLGSYAAGAAVGTALLAHDLLLAKIRTEVANGISPPGKVPTPGQIAGLTRRLLAASDRCQAKVRPDGRVDRMDSSHTRSRAATRAALDAHPVPWGAGAEEVDAWVERLGDYAAALLVAAFSLIDPAEER